MLKFASWAGVLLQNYTFPITVGKKFCCHYKLFLMLFHEEVCFDYSFLCCYSSTLMDKTEIMTKNKHFLMCFFARCYKKEQLLLVNLFFYSLCQRVLTYSLKLHKKSLHERALKIVYNDYKTSFQQLLGKYNSVTIHQPNLQTLACKIFK